MANYVPSNLLAAQVNLTGRFQAGEMRFRDPVVFKSLIRNQSLIMEEDYSTMRTREDRAVQLNFFNRTVRTLGTARSHTHTGSKGDTTLLTPSFSTKSDVFLSSLKQADKNKRTLQEMLNNELSNVIRNFADGAELLASTFLFSNRSGVNGVTQEGSFDGTNDVFEIAVADEARAVQISRMVMDILKYQGMSFDIYCDSISFNKFEYLRAQGSSNDTNTEFQFTNGSLTFYHASDLNALVAPLGTGAYSKGFWLVVPSGMAAAFDWIPKQNREGVASTSIGGVAEYGNIINPIDGLSYAVHKTWTGADGSSTNGYTQDVNESVEVSIDYSFESAPLTTANETVIQAFGIV